MSRSAALQTSAALSPADAEALSDSVRRLLAHRSTEADVRRAMETQEGFDPALWRALSDLGVPGLMIDEAFGGVGAGPEALERVMEAGGAALLCAPLTSSGVLAAGLLKALGDAEAQSRLLPGIADGSRIATVALTGAAAGWRREDVTVQANKAASGWSLDGEASFVTDGHVADVLLVVANGPDGPCVHEVDPRGPGLTIEVLPTFDRTLRLARIRFSAAPGRLLNASGDAWAAVEAALDLARVALAGEQAGAARRVLDFTVEYAKSRIQFGRPIGSFQAIKHMAADLLLEVESATSAARHAARQLASGAPDGRAAVSLAAFACGEAFVRVASDAVQMHGGIAFTWDHPAHLYLRRARADAELFGSPAFHRERYLQASGG